MFHNKAGFQNSLNMFAHAKALKYNMLTAKPQNIAQMTRCKSSIMTSSFGAEERQQNSIFKERQEYVDEESVGTPNLPSYMVKRSQDVSCDERSVISG